jgi:exodeoxyribonuclease-5
VFVAQDVFWPKEEQLRRQLVYVAVSRASQAVTIEAGPASLAAQSQWHNWLVDSDVDTPTSDKDTKDTSYT